MRALESAQLVATSLSVHAVQTLHAAFTVHTQAYMQHKYIYVRTA